MSFSFENQGTMTWLVYNVSLDDNIDSMSLGMLTNNRIPGLAQAVFTQMDNSKYIKYNVSSKVSVKQFFEGSVNKKRLLGVFSGIVDAMMSAEDYMIDTGTILLDLNYIFADVSTCDTILICLPVLGKGTATDLATFFKTIMFSTQFDQTENCDHVARIINYLNSTPVFSLIDFKAVLDSLKGTNTQVHTQPVAQPQVQRISQPRPVQQHEYPVQPIQPVQAVQPPQQKASVQASHESMTYQQNPSMQQSQWAVPVPQQRVNPAKSVPPAQPPTMTQQPASNEKQVSMFNLLMHYNKENKRLYQEQKAAKKAAKAQGVTASPPVQPQQPGKQQNIGFSIPGAPANMGFAIPGQSAPPVKAQQPTMATPPQQPKRMNPQQQPARPMQPPMPAVNQPTQQRVQPSQPMQQPAQVVQPSQPMQQPSQPAYYPAVVPQGKPASFGETTVLGGSNMIGETTVLGGGSADIQFKPHLIRTKNNERINLNKPVFRIGKEKSYVDYFVSDNTAVSRSHANIISREGQYFIVDTNSTNHTYINGGMIQSNVETLLTHGTKIRLANEEFEFKLY